MTDIEKKALALLTEAEWRELLARHTFRDFIPGLIADLHERGLIAPEPEPDGLAEAVNDAWSNTISRLASGEFKVSEVISTMISGVNFDAMRDALTAELRARGVTAPARGEG